MTAKQALGLVSGFCVALLLTAILFFACGFRAGLGAADKAQADRARLLEMR